jgi:hypothetical protein
MQMAAALSCEIAQLFFREIFSFFGWHEIALSGKYFRKRNETRNELKPFLNYVNEPI